MVLVRSKEVKVENSGWPDYVLDEDYAMNSLEELEVFIKKHEIPTQEQIGQEGQNLGAIQAKLLEKTEEQTLYLIHLKKAGNTKAQKRK